MSRAERAAKLTHWRTSVGEHRSETQWFYDQAETNEAARIILSEEVEELKSQIAGLAKVLLEDCGGPTKNEGACEMAARLLREQAAIQNWRGA